MIELPPGLTMFPMNRFKAGGGKRQHQVGISLVNREQGTETRLLPFPTTWRRCITWSKARGA